LELRILENIEGNSRERDSFECIDCVAKGERSRSLKILGINARNNIEFTRKRQYNRSLENSDRIMLRDDEELRDLIEFIEAIIAYISWYY